MDKSGVIELVRKQRNESTSSLSGQYENTKKAFSFYDAEDSTYKDNIQFKDSNGRKRRAEVVFNDIKSNVDAVSGFMSQNRRQAKFSARVQGKEAQEMYSKYKNSIYTYMREDSNADQLESDQDRDMLICGYGAIETDLSYIIGNATTTPYGEIIKNRIDPENVGWDGQAKGKNLLDARWAYYYREYDLKEAVELLDANEEDFAQDNTTDGDLGYEYNPYGGVYDKIKTLDNVDWVSKANERVKVFNHQWFEYETFYRAPNPIFTASTPEDALFMKAKLELIEANDDVYELENIDSDDDFALDLSQEEIVLSEKMMREVKREFGDIGFVPFKRKCFYTAVYSGSHVFSCFKSISQQGFSIKFKTGSYNRTRKMWVGMVNAMMEPQKYYNKALTELMFTISSNSKGGVMVEEDAVQDIKEFERNYARTDAVIRVRSGALSQGKIQEKKSPAIPTGLENIITLSEQSITKNGVDPSFVGSLEREDASGIQYKRRIRQVISKFAHYFDSITLYQKEDARLCSDLIRVWVQNNAGQTVRVTGDMDEQMEVMLSEDNLAGEYDVTIQEAAQTSEDKQETSMIINQYGDKLAAIGDVNTAKTFYAQSLQFLNLDGETRNTLTGALQEQNQQTVPLQQYQMLEAQLQQMQSQMAQLQVAKVESDIRKTDAETQVKMADVQKTQADITKTLEESAKQGLENDLLRDGVYNDVNVTI